MEQKLRAHYSELRLVVYCSLLAHFFLNGLLHLSALESGKAGVDGHGQLAFFNGTRRNPVLAHRSRLEIGLGADASDLLGLLLPALLLKQVLLLLLPGLLGLDGLVEDFSLGTPLFGSQQNFHYLSGLFFGADAVSDWLAALLQGRGLKLTLR